MNINNIIEIAASQGGGTGVSGYPYTNSEAAAYVARMSVAPNDTRKGAIDDFFGALKTAGVYTLRDEFWLWAAHDEQASRLGCKNVSNGTVYGTPTFTADRGWQGTASAAHGINTTYNPTTAGLGYALNDAALFAVVTASTSSIDDCGWTETNFSARSNGGPGAKANINLSGFLGGGTTSGTRFIGVQRETTALNPQTWWKDGVATATDAASTADTLPNSNLTILASTPGGNTSGRIIAYTSVGRYTDATQTLAEYTAVKAYLAAVGLTIT